MPYRRGRTSIPGRQHISAFFSDGPELSPWAATLKAARHGRDSPDRATGPRMRGRRGRAVPGTRDDGISVTLGSPGSSSDGPDDAAAAMRQVSNDTAPRAHASRSAAGPAALIKARHGGPDHHGAGWAYDRQPARREPARARAVRGCRAGGLGVSWTSSCRAGRRGHLVVQESPEARHQVEIDRSGRTGGGTIWLFRDPGYAFPDITSTAHGPCSVVLRDSPDAGGQAASRRWADPGDCA